MRGNQALVREVDGEEHLKVYRGWKERIGMKPQLHAPMYS